MIPDSPYLSAVRSLSTLVPKHVRTWADLTASIAGILSERADIAKALDGRALHVVANSVRHVRHCEEKSASGQSIYDSFFVSNPKFRAYAVQLIAGRARVATDDIEAFTAAVDACSFTQKWLRGVLATSYRAALLADAHAAWLAAGARRPRRSAVHREVEARPGAVPRVACARCLRSVASMPPDYRGRPRERPHNCPHKVPCRQKAYELNTDGMPPKQAARMIELDAWTRERYPRSYLPPCPKCAAARVEALSIVPVVPAVPAGSVALLMSARAAASLPGGAGVEARPCGGEIVSLTVRADDVGKLVSGQRLARYRPRRVDQGAAALGGAA